MMSTPSAAACLVMPRLGELAQVGDGLPTSPGSFGLGPRRVPLAEPGLRVEPCQSLAEQRVARPSLRLRPGHEVGELDDQVGVGRRVQGGVAGAAAEEAALRPRRREPRVRTSRTDAGPLEIERRLGDGPAVALAADEVGGVADGIVEEDLVEHGLARHLAQRTDGHARLIERECEPRDTGMLGHREVRPGEQHPVVGLHGHAAPHLLPVDDPAFAVALGPSRQSGQVGAGAGLAEQLAPGHLPLEDRRHQACDLVG